MSEEQLGAQEELESPTNEVDQQQVEDVAQTEDIQSSEPEVDQESVAEKVETSDAVQKRINKLTYEKYEAQRQQEAMARQVEELKRAQQQASAVAATTGEPTLESCDYDEAKYMTELVNHKVSQQMQAVTAQQTQVAQQAQQQTAVNDFQQRQKAFAEKDSDYVELVQTVGGAISSPVVEQFVLNSGDNGLKVHKALLQNVAEAQRIQSLPEWQQGAELAKLEAKFSNVKTVQKSKAPAPANTVANTSGKASGRLKGAARDFKL